MLIHREALELARNAADDGDGIPFSMTCVYVTEDGAVTVTDGHLWLRMQGAVDEPNLFDELADKGAGAKSDGPVLVPADVMAAFNAAMKKRKAKKGQPIPHVVVTQVNNNITLASSDGKTKRTFPLAYGVPARVGRLRGYGNAIVPQVAQVFIEAYMSFEQ